MILKEVLDKSVLFLKNKGLESPRLDAEILISFALKIDRMGVYLKFDKPLLEDELVTCRKLILERSKGIPVAYLIGQKGFYGYDFFVNNSVLVPRPETELLVEYVLEWIKTKNILNSKILDLGSGSGCIPIAIAAELIKKSNKPNSITSVDVSKEALAVAKKNAQDILKENCEIIQFINADAFIYQTDELFDIIVSNPPYISESDTQVQKSVRDFEPHLALFAPEEGFKCIQDWARFGVHNLKPNGLLIFEIGCLQGDKALQFFNQIQAFHSIEIIKDYSGLDRFIKAVRNG